METLIRLSYIGLFGLLGVFSRYFMGMGISRLTLSPFPYGTFTINIVGSFLIGVIYVVGLERAIISPNLRLGLMVGFLGGFTTFSSFSLESMSLLEKTELWYGLLYFILSPLLGLAAAFLGLNVSRYFLRG